MQNNTSNNGNDVRKTSKRGFASMDPEKRREIASKGGKAVSKNNEHMVEIGRKGGAASGETRRHASQTKNENQTPADISLNLPADATHTGERAYFSR